MTYLACRTVDQLSVSVPEGECVVKTLGVAEGWLSESGSVVSQSFLERMQHMYLRIPDRDLITDQSPTW